MRRVLLALATLVVTGWTTAPQCAAQVAASLEAGAAVPAGGWGVQDGGGGGYGAQVGFHIAAGVDVPVGEGPFALGGRVFYATFSYDNLDLRDETSGLLAGTVTATLAARTEGTFAPYATAELGVMRHAFESNLAPNTDEVGGVFGIGGGVRIRLGPRHGGQLAVRYVDSLTGYDPVQFVGISAGLRFGL